MDHSKMIDEYLAGPDALRRAIAGMSPEQLDARPIAGQWSTRQVVCHLADFEPVYADRMKRVIAEETPTILAGDPDLFAARLAYDHRAIDVELEIITAVREQMAMILRQLQLGDFQRIGNHSEAGPLSLEVLLQRITAHVPHHVKFIAEKRKSLGV